MVSIPTSRDVAFVGTRSGRIAPSGPSVSVGAAVAEAGQNIVQAAYNLNDLRTQENADVLNDKANEVSTSLTRFLTDEEDRFLKAREQSSESGIGFTRQFMEGHQERANAFAKSNFEGLSKDAQTQYLNNILGRGNALFEKANSYETQAKTNFYDRTTNSNLDQVRTQIGSNAAPYDQLKKQGLAAIDATNMPEPWKAERRALWDSDAAESKWQWKFKQNPKEALAEIKGTPDARALLRKEEGFREKPYWDTNAWRIGYGSDTVTLADGSHVPVTENMTITREDAERDLQYRLTEREGAKAKEQVGAAWDGLSGNVQAALQSVAYNYGSLPSEVVKAAQSGDMGAVANAVEGLSANKDRRKREADIIRGSASIPASTSEYDAISYDRRQQLAAAGENEYNQVVTRERAASKDRYSLLIASKPEGVDENVILNDTSIDNGDKAQLITSLRSAKKESDGVNAFLGAFANGDVSVNPFDGKQTGIADKGYDKLMTGAANDDERKVITSDFINRMGYIPKKVQAELRRGASSTDPAVVAQSMEAGLVLSKNAPISFNAFEGSGVVRDKMDLYRAYTQDMGYSPQEAARRLVDAADPAKASQRDALLKSKTVADELKKVSTDTVASAFDAGFFASSPSLGPTPQAEAVMVSEYRSIYQEAIVDAGGDLIAAKKAADTRFQRSYGVSNLSTLGNNVVVKNPPEKAYPAAPDGTFDYIRDQLAQSMKNQGISADDYYLQPYEMTEKDIRAGKPPRYSVFYKKDGKIERYNLPFVADPEVMKKSFKAQKTGALSTSEEKMTDNRAREVQVRQNVDTALQNTEGPDWMKAQAAGAVRERARQDKTIEDLGGFNPGPIGTGGGGGY